MVHIVIYNSENSFDIHRTLKYCNKSFKTSLKIWKYKIGLLYILNKTNLTTEREAYSTVQSHFTLISAFNESVIKNTLVKKYDHFCLFGRVSPDSWTNIIMRKQNLSRQSNFPIKFYHNSNFGFLVNFNFVLWTWRISYGESRLRKICIICLVVTILNPPLFRKNIYNRQLTAKLTVIA